ncbi:AAA family ATPase [Thiocapsa sp.]|uniref:AAA family ATPase n=1 Tax=Thiocapsa sp. TaxID=2024551 RepID=UPI0034579E66
MRALLIALLRQVAAPEHPLVLFLDDLQWADQPSLDFIGALLEDTALRGLLLIGAYRDNEVDAAHPLLRLLRQPTATGAPAQVLTLASLTAGDMTRVACRHAASSAGQRATPQPPHSTPRPAATPSLRSSF